MTVFGKIVGSTMKEEAYKRIKDAIITGKLKPDDSLVEMEISREMNISRAPIREALNKLEQEQFVVSIPRKGYHVSSITKEGIKEIYEARYLMEPYAIRQTVDKIPMDEITEIERIINDLASNTEDFEKYINADKEIHGLLHKYLSNGYLKNIIVTIEEHSMRTRYSESYEGLNKTDVLTIIQEHLDIIEAIKSRNPEKAELAVRNHIKNAEKRTLKPIISRSE